VTTITARHVNGDRFTVSVRDHLFAVDQPVADGGEDTAPTPTELFVAGLVSCVGFYAGRYLARHNLPVEGLCVTGDYEITSRPARVGSIRIDITLPEGVPDNRRDALLAVASHCTVHNSLATPPEVTVAFAGTNAVPA
jgi:putative redox protein